MEFRCVSAFLGRSGQLIFKEAGAGSEIIAEDVADPIKKAEALKTEWDALIAGEGFQKEAAFLILKQIYALADANKPQDLLKATRQQAKSYLLIEDILASMFLTEKGQRYAEQYSHQLEKERWAQECKDRKIQAQHQLTERIRAEKSRESGDEKLLESFNLSELLPEINEYKKHMESLLALVYDNTESRVSEEVTAAITSKVLTGPLQNQRQWSETLGEQGYYGHLIAFYLQLFRNSDSAQKIAKIYKQLGVSGKMALEKMIRNEIKNPRVFEFMFALPTLPVIFDPRERPGHLVVTKKSQSATTKMIDAYTIYNADGQEIFHGNHDEIYENSAYAYDEHGNMILSMHYYDNKQPNFMFTTYNEKGEKGKREEIKTYTHGSKAGPEGPRFYYVIMDDRNIVLPPSPAFTPDQSKAVKKFFNLRF